MIPAFFFTPLGKKIGLAAVGALVLMIVAGSIYQRGKSAGYGDGQRAQLDDDKKSLDQERGQFQDALTRAQTQIQQSDARRQASEQAQAQLQQALVLTAQARQQAAAKVAALPDSGLFADVVGKLDAREKTDATPNFAAPELRKIDNIVTDYTGLKTQYEQLAAKQDQMAAEIIALDSKLDGVTKQRDAAIEWGNQLMGHYAKAYNAAQKKPGILKKIVTLGLAKGKHLDIPDPVTLKPPAGATP